MKDSTTYRAILEEGRLEDRAEEARRILRSIGTHQFGKPSPTVSRVLRSSSIDSLERMIHRLDETSSWDDLVAGDGG